MKMNGLFDWVLTWLGKRIEKGKTTSSRRFVLYFHLLSFPLLDREKRGILKYDQYKSFYLIHLSEKLKNGLCETHWLISFRNYPHHSLDIAKQVEVT